jgi:hypothetical protein
VADDGFEPGANRVRAGEVLRHVVLESQQLLAALALAGIARDGDDDVALA